MIHEIFHILGLCPDHLFHFNIIDGILLSLSEYQLTWNYIRLYFKVKFNI